MRLLLDEHLSPHIAQELRAVGHDVVAAQDVGLRQVADEDVFRWAVADRRALVTANLRDFRPLHARHLSRGEAHYGLIFVSRRHSLGRRGVGDVVRALEDVLQLHPADEALLSTEHWL